MKLLIKNGYIVSPADNLDGIFDLLVEDGKIAEIAAKIDVGDQTEVFDAKGLHLFPGFIDLHVHLRDPGQEYKEDIASGVKAAACGGFTRVVSMPNTLPVVDCRAVVEYITSRAKAAKGIKVHPVGAISLGSKGVCMAAYDEMIKAGIVGVSDDGRPVEDPLLLRRVFEYLLPSGLPVISHSEDLRMRGDGVMNEGALSFLLGLSGIPSLAEDLAVQRDIEIAEYTKGRLHLAHLSTKGSVRLLRAAKARGVRVTAEAAPHHLLLNEELVRSYDTNYKMNPPLRTEEDRLALVEALVDGTIDAVATDHAPHAPCEKDVEFDRAPFGVIGLETAFASCYTHLVLPGTIKLSALVDRMSTSPAKILGQGGGSLAKGTAADLTLIDLAQKWTVSEATICSRSRNSAFLNQKLNAKTKLTVSDGRIVYQNQKTS